MFLPNFRQTTFGQPIYHYLDTITGREKQQDISWQPSHSRYPCHFAPEPCFSRRGALEAQWLATLAPLQQADKDE